MMIENAGGLLIVMLLCYAAVTLIAFLCWRIENEKE